MKGMMKMWHLLVVEDEPDIARVLERGLVYKGFAVTVARSGEMALSHLEALPDLVLLDVMLPDIDGFELCRRIRAMGHATLPILMLTAKDAQADKIAGLDCGADDYITKPFDFEELLARIRAALRRVREQSSSLSKIEVADVLIDPTTRQVWRGSDLLELTVREYDLLELLARNAGQVLTKGQIFEQVWGDDNDIGWEVVKVYVNLLRSKLNAGGKVDLIHTVRGIGYMLM